MHIIKRIKVVLFCVAVLNSFLAYATPSGSGVTETSFCLHHNSYFANLNGTSPTCFPIEGQSAGERHNLPVHNGYGSIDAGSIVTAIFLYKGLDGQGESCTVQGNRFNGYCGGADWRWKANSILLHYGTCRLVYQDVNFRRDGGGNRHNILWPDSYSMPVALGICPDFFNASDLYDRILNDSDINVSGVCVPADFGVPGSIPSSTPTFSFSIPGNGISEFRRVSLPTRAICLNVPVPRLGHF